MFTGASRINPNLSWNPRVCWNWNPYPNVLNPSMSTLFLLRYTPELPNLKVSNHIEICGIHFVYSLMVLLLIK